MIEDFLLNNEFASTFGLYSTEEMFDFLRYFSGMKHLTADIVLLEKLGSGGMAEVYAGQLNGLNGFQKSVAIKMPYPQVVSEPHFRELFLNEAKLTAKLVHPNIAQTFQVGEAEGIPFIVMERIKGETLKELVETSKRTKKLISWQQACRIVDQIACGLHYAHTFVDEATNSQIKVIHRDLSPHNVMLDQFGNVKLLDFGVSRALEGAADQTVTKHLAGKAAYLSPEMVKGLPIDERSDLFSLGVIFYELLTGERLFKGQNDYESIKNVIEIEPGDILAVRTDVPKEVNGIIKGLLQKDANKRIQRALEIRNLISPLLRSETIGSVYSTCAIDQMQKPSDNTLTDAKVPMQKQSEPRRLKTAVLTTLGVLLIIFALANFKRSPTIQSPPSRNIAQVAGQSVNTQFDPDSCPIIGNVITKIYHGRGDRDYLRMVTGSETAHSHHQCFNSEQDALQHGFRKSKR